MYKETYSRSSQRFYFKKGGIDVSLVLNLVYVVSHKIYCATYYYNRSWREDGGGFLRW